MVYQDTQTFTQTSPETSPETSGRIMQEADDRKKLCNEACNELRKELLLSEQKIRELMNYLLYSNTPLRNPLSESEEYQQAVIALRDCEASRMRLGKVIQYLSDGVSIYDKK